ncbi:hypothetical protein [Nocardioides sp.]|uniref:YqeB family protein n=1 Tax=Nocardioides sp. TaxID=35761 RepID=UPI00273611D7|nr:hypothetical protein [Nocardioides sp.]MDP3894069.1 hypothetical protein [Nocardioides sp.]
MSRGQDDDAIRVENSFGARVSVSALLAAIAVGIATLVWVRRWAETSLTVAAAAVIIAALVAFFMSPEALRVSVDDVRDESGWRRTGWRVLRSEVALVRWDPQPDLFEPPQLTFLDEFGEVVLQTTVEFDPAEVSEALEARGWPLESPATA